VLKAWPFPADVTDSLANHHDEPDTVKSALSRTLVGGEALARVAMVQASGVKERYEAEVAMAEEEAAALQLVRVDHESVVGLASQVRRGGEELAASLQVD